MANKYLDSNGLLYFWSKIKAKFVEKETGKGLSTNDYTTTEKNKLAGLSDYTLPTASADTKGGVKIGSGLTMTGDVLSADVGGSVSWSNITDKPLGQASGVATLDSDGKVPSSQLPSYVDDIIEGYYNGTGFYEEQAYTTAITGESGKIYVDIGTYSTNSSYRYGGTTFTKITSSDMVAVTNAEIDTVVAS